MDSDNDDLFIVVNTEPSENNSQTELDAAILEDANKLFNEMDTNQGGTITHDEVDSFAKKADSLLKESYGESEVIAFFESICKDGSECSKDQFVSSFIKLAKSGNFTLKKTTILKITNKHPFFWRL